MPEGPWGRDADANALITHLDILEIERAVVFAPYGSDFGGDQRRANEWLLEEASRSTRLTPFATLDPTRPESVSILHQMCLADAKGCKLHPAVQRFDVADERALDFYRASAEFGIPLAIHTGAMHGRPVALDDPAKLDRILFETPGLRMILEHAGGRLWFELALAIAANHGGRSPRAYLGLTSVLERPSDVLTYLGPERVLDLVTGVGGRQLVFGLDFPYWTLDDNRRALKAVHDLPVARQERELILGGALRRLLQADKHRHPPSAGQQITEQQLPTPGVTSSCRARGT
jgi:predicted TIM-barrel fold metal-dependent hydrolase